MILTIFIVSFRSLFVIITIFHELLVYKSSNILINFFNLIFNQVKSKCLTAILLHGAKLSLIISIPAVISATANPIKILSRSSHGFFVYKLVFLIILY